MDVNFRNVYTAARCFKPIKPIQGKLVIEAVKAIADQYQEGYYGDDLLVIGQGPSDEYEHIAVLSRIHDGFVPNELYPQIIVCDCAWEPMKKKLVDNDCKIKIREIREAVLRFTDTLEHQITIEQVGQDKPILLSTLYKSHANRFLFDSEANEAYSMTELAWMSRIAEKMLTIRLSINLMNINHILSKICIGQPVNLRTLEEIKKYIDGLQWSLSP